MITKKEKTRLVNQLPKLINSIGSNFASISVSNSDIQRLLEHQKPKNFVLSFDTDVVFALNSVFKYLFNKQPSISVQTLKHINELVAFDALEPGEFAQQSMSISGIKYHPPVPSQNEAESILHGSLNEHVSTPIKAIHLMLRLWRAQLFWDGNKRTGWFMANYWLWLHHKGILFFQMNQFNNWSTAITNFYNSGKIYPLTKLIKKYCYHTNL